MMKRIVQIGLLVVVVIFWLGVEFGIIGQPMEKIVKLFKIGKVEVGSTAPLIEGGGRWFNSDGYRPEDLKGKVVLVSFWTYSCVNCVRTLPYLNKWDSEYRDKGLVIIGVHSPEFEFEKDDGNLSNSLKRFGINYPVVADNDKNIWNAYKNQYWPHKFLIDANGVIRYHRVGEGGYEEIERNIVALLIENGSKVSLSDGFAYEEGMSADGQEKKIREEVNDEPPFKPIKTGSTYFGRMGFSNFGNFDTEGPRDIQTLVYPNKMAENLFYLDGTWKIEKEYIESVSPKSGILIAYRAAGVNIVAQNDGEETTVEIMVDRMPVQEGDRGEDLIVDNNGRSYVKIKEARMYNLLNHKYGFGIHTLELVIANKGLRGYLFSFE